MQKLISKRVLSFLLALTMCISMAVTVFAAEMTFTDVHEGDWYYEDVKYAVEKLGATVSKNWVSYKNASDEETDGVFVGENVVAVCHNATV